MSVNESLMKDLNTIMEKLEENIVFGELDNGKKFRRWTDSLNRVFYIIKNRGEIEFVDLSVLRIKIDEVIENVGKFKTTLLSNDKENAYYNVIVGYEKLLRISEELTKMIDKRITATTATKKRLGISKWEHEVEET